MGINERKEREKEHRKEEIINAAESVFFDKGLQQATMDEIAEKAELGKSTLYLYYKSKEDLYMGIVLRGSDVLYNMFQDVISMGGPAVKIISKLGEAYYEFFKQHKNYFRSFHFFENPQTHKQVSPEMMEQCSTENGKIWAMLVTLIKQGIEEGDVQSNLDPMQIAVLLWANSNILMRQMDREDGYWKDMLGVDLDATLKLSQRLIIESIVTDDAKRKYPELVV